MDLHLHSHHSDGRLTPTEEIRRAVGAGHRLVALTDHDSTDGNAEAAAEAERHGVTFIPGVEVTCQLPEGSPPQEIHMLGYFTPSGHPALEELLERSRAALLERLGRVLVRLRTLHGHEFTLEEIQREAQPARFVDRPHLARLMVQRGILPDEMTAFVRHLGDEGDCHLPLHGPTWRETIEAIHAAGGIASVAHPRFFDFPTGATVATLRPVVEAGLDALEVHHSAHSPAEEERFAALAEEFGLTVTGGSDCHGKAGQDGRIATETWKAPRTLESTLREAWSDRLT